MKIAVLGAAGQLGSSLASAFEASRAVTEVQRLTRAELDVTRWLAVDSYLMTERPTVVVNCTAFHNVVACEQDPGAAESVNHLAVMHLAIACGRVGAQCVHVSTDYVFDGEQRTPYVEDDLPRPLQVYGRSKRSGEIAVLMNPANLVVRTSSLFGVGGRSSKGGDFPSRMLRAARDGKPLQVRTDLTMAPTYVPDLAHAIVRCVQEGVTGVVHLTGGQAMTWYQFALAVFGAAKRSVVLEVDPQPAPDVARPAYSVLRSSRVASLPGVFERIQEYVERLTAQEAACRPV